ncbi:MAG: two-component system, OmpR family, sensor histidine kinase KdpD, partial [Gaiellales bacterium]|nr:two-component system, OmpR family, sensor histidine kinase KdpD [Gaiellales bacterium]
MEREVDERLPPPQTDALSRVLAGVIPPIGLLVALEVALYPFRNDLNTGTIALVLLVPVLLSTVGGVWTALGVAVLGALSFNFFFTQPYYSFRIESSESIAAFVAYLVVGTIVAVAVSRQRDATYLAGRRSQHARFLQNAAENIARSDDPASDIARGLRDLRAILRLNAIRLVGDSTGHGTIDEGYGDDERARAAIGATGEQAEGQPATGPVTVVIRSGKR